MINQKLTTKRFTAYVLDVVLVYFFIVLVSNIRFINPTYNKLLEVTETYNETVEAYENDKITSELSDAISADLKKRGMTFVGSTIIYSYLQAVGVIYSHEPGCYLEKK